MSLPQENVLKGQQFILVVQQLNSSIELIQIAAWLFNFQRAFKEVKLVRIQYNSIDKSIFCLQIGLPIQIGRFNIAKGILFSSIK